MKKLVITMSIVLISLLGYSQVTNVGEFRIANATTAFGVNLPSWNKSVQYCNKRILGSNCRSYNYGNSYNSMPLHLQN